MEGSQAHPRGCTCPERPELAQPGVPDAEGEAQGLSAPEPALAQAARARWPLPGWRGAALGPATEEAPLHHRLAELGGS